MKKDTLTLEKAKKSPAGGVLVGKREGQTMIYDDATVGGYFVGKLHKEGGIQGINKTTGQPIEVQSSEVIITAPAVADQTKREFQGEMLTNREILSKINVSGGGVSLEQGGDIPSEIYFNGSSYNYGGKTMTDYEIMQSMNDCGCEHEYNNGGNLEKVPLKISNKVKKISDRILEIEKMNLGDDIYSYNGNYSFKERAKLISEQEKLQNELTEVTDKLTKEQCYSINSESFRALNTAGDYGYEEDYSFGGSFKNGGEIEKLIKEGQIDLKFYKTTPTHAKEYGIECKNPIYIQTLYITKENRLNGLGKKTLKYLDDYCKKNGNDVIFGHISNEVEFTKDERTSYFSDVELMKYWLHDKGYAINDDNNDFHKVVNVKYNNGGQMNLAEKSKKGDHPSRDLNNYNDVLDMEADGMVGSDSGLAFAKGGNVDKNIQIGDLFVMDLPNIYRNVDYGKKRQVAIVTNTNDAEKITIYNGGVYFHIKETSLLSKKKSTLSEVLKEFRKQSDMSVSQNLFSVVTELKKEVISDDVIELLKQRYPNRDIRVNNQYSFVEVKPNYLTDKITYISKVKGYYLIQQYGFKEDEYYIFDSIEDAINLKYGQPIYAKGGITPYDANLEGDSVDTIFKDGGATLSAEVFEWDKVPTNYRNISKVKKVPFTNNPMDKGLDSIIAPFLGKDELRPVGMGINFDKNGITATDFHKLITLPYPNEKYEGIYDINRVKKIKADQPILIDGNYPNYEAIIPKSNIISGYEVDVYKLLQYTKTAINYANKTTKGISFKFGDNERIGFNGSLLLEVLTASLKLGHEKLYAKITAPNRAMVLSPNKNYEVGNDDILLIMPIMLTSTFGTITGYGAEDIDYKRSLKAYFDFNDSEIHNADGSVAQFKMQYENNLSVDDKYLALLNKITSKNQKLAILNYAKVEDGKMTATDLDVSLIIKDVNMPNGMYEIVNNAPNITMYPIEDFPKERVFKSNEVFVNHNGSKLVAFEFVTFSEVFEFYLDKLLLSKGIDELRPVMSGICIKKTSDNELFLVTTNAHTLCKINITEYCEFEKDDRELEYILPTKYLKDFIKLADGSLHFKCNLTNVFIEADNLEYIARAIDNKYPNYEAVIPKQNDKMIVFDHAQMNKCLKSKEYQELIAKYKGQKNIYFEFTNSSDKLFVCAYEDLGYNRAGKLVDELELCSIDFNFKEVDKTFTQSDSLFLLMPKINTPKENQYFTFGQYYFDVMLETITDTEVECYFTEPNRAYIFPIDAIDYKKTLPDEKTKQQKLSKKDLEQISELEDLKDVLEPIAEIVPAIENKKYVIESKGFREGIGSSSYKQKREKQKDDIKNQIEKIELQEAIETLEMLIETAKGKDKKDIKEALEILKMLNENN